MSLRRADSNYEFNIRKHMSLTKREEANLAKLEEYEKYEWLVEVSQLRVGDSFGELALQEDTPRQMTI